MVCAAFLMLTLGQLVDKALAFRPEAGRLEPLLYSPSERGLGEISTFHLMGFVGTMFCIQGVPVSIPYISRWKDFRQQSCDYPFSLVLWIMSRPMLLHSCLDFGLSTFVWWEENAGLTLKEESEGWIQDPLRPDTLSALCPRVWRAAASHLKMLLLWNVLLCSKAWLHCGSIPCHTGT